MPTDIVPEEEVKKRYGEEAARQYREAMQYAREAKARDEIKSVGGAEYTREAYEQAGQPRTREEVEAGHERVAAIIEKKSELAKEGVKLGTPQYSRARDELTYLARGILPPPSPKYHYPLEWYPVRGPSGEDLTLQQMLKMGIGQERYLEAKGKVEYLPEVTFKFTKAESAIQKSHAATQKPAAYGKIEVAPEAVERLGYPRTTEELRERLAVVEQELKQGARVLDFTLPPIEAAEKLLAGPTGPTFFPMRREVVKGAFDVLRTPAGLEELARGALARGAAIKETIIKEPKLAAAIAVGGLAGFGKTQIEAFKESPVRYGAGVAFTSLAIEGVGKGVSKIVSKVPKPSLPEYKIGYTGAGAPYWARTPYGELKLALTKTGFRVTEAVKIPKIPRIVKVTEYSISRPTGELTTRSFYALERTKPFEKPEYKSVSASASMRRFMQDEKAMLRLALEIDRARKEYIEKTKIIDVRPLLEAPKIEPSAGWRGELGYKWWQVEPVVKGDVKATPVVSPALKPAAKAKPTVAMKLTPKERIREKLIPPPIQASKPVQRIGAAQAAKQVPKQTTILKTITVSPPTLTARYTYREMPKPPSIPSVGYMVFEKLHKKEKLPAVKISPRQAKAYQPSVMAVGLKIKAPKAPKVVVGPEIRPMVRLRK